MANGCNAAYQRAHCVCKLRRSTRKRAHFCAANERYLWMSEVFNASSGNPFDGTKCRHSIRANGPEKKLKTKPNRQCYSSKFSSNWLCHHSSRVWRIMATIVRWHRAMVAVCAEYFGYLFRPIIELLFIHNIAHAHFWPIVDMTSSHYDTRLLLWLFGVCYCRTWKRRVMCVYSRITVFFFFLFFYSKRRRWDILHGHG